MRSKNTLHGSLVAAAVFAIVGNAPASAQDVVRIGFSAPLTGPFAENGRQMSAALTLFAEQNGTAVAGRKIEVILRDDGGVPDQAKRLAQELGVNGKVAVLAGYNPTPAALAVAPIATEAKIPQLGHALKDYAFAALRSGD